MKPFFSTLLAITLMHLATPVQAAESVVNFSIFSLILPDGYTDHPAQGIDSRCGHITIEGKPFKIRYDTYSWKWGEQGEKKLSEFDKDDLDELFYYERIQEAPFATCIFAGFYSNDSKRTSPFVTLDVLGFGMFTIRLDSTKDVEDAIEVLRAIKVTKEKPIAP